MSTLKTNTISTNDANNVALSNQLNLKSYTTTARNALTSVAGDMIYNTTTSKAEFYDGSNWQETGGADISTFTVNYLVIGGGGGGGAGEQHTSGDQAGGGGGGQLRASFNSETSGGGSSSESALTINKGVPIPISIGGGGAGNKYPGTGKIYGSNGGSGIVVIRYQYQGS